MTFDAIKRHTWLSSDLLYYFTAREWKDRWGYLKRLEALTKQAKLCRHPSLNNENVFNDFLNYTLEERGFHLPDDLRHSAMTIAATANLDIGARATGFKYISQAEIIDRLPPRKYALSMPNGRVVDGKTRYTTPDALCGIEYGNGVRFFAIEADRGTETLDTKIRNKLKAYDYILKKKEYQKLFDIPVLYPMVVTTTEARMNSMIKIAEELFGSSSLILFTYINGFTGHFRSPRYIPDFFTREWNRAGKPPFRIDKA